MPDNGGIGTDREGRTRGESLEGHASSSSQPAVATDRRSPDIVLLNLPGREIGIEFRMPAYSGSPTRVGEKMGIFLFEVFVTPDDLRGGMLLIPVEAALDYFPMLPKYPDHKEKIVVSDYTNFEWCMTLGYDRSECSFTMGSLWQNFVFRNHLDVMDVLRFYKSIPLSDDNYYLVEIVTRRDLEIIEEFEPEDFLFQLSLTEAEILLERVFIPAEEVSNHFPAVGIPAETHDMERLYFTDYRRSFWRIRILCYYGTFQFLMNQFITEHNLEEGDMIKFYKPIRPLNSRHFLVVFVRERVSTPTPLETAATEPVTPTPLETAATTDSTDSTGRGSDTQGDSVEGTDGGSNTQGDDGGGTDGDGNTQGDDVGGSRSGRRRSWWQFSFGGCCMALKSNPSTEES